MNTLFKHAKRELFSLSTLALVAVPLIMSMQGPDGGLDKFNKQISGMTSSLTETVGTLTPNNVEREIGQSVNMIKTAARPVRLGMKNAGFGGGSVYRSGAKPIYLSSL